MKFIHCADLHFDSKLNANLDQESAKARKAEILNTFVRMVAFAAKHQVGAILIVGDLFDTKNSSATARNTLLYEITEHPSINFYYLRGNHDEEVNCFREGEIPQNLKIFDDQWTTYFEADNKITISGIEFPAKNPDTIYQDFVLNMEKFNIVMLHGQEMEGAGKDNTEVINLKALRGKGIDYLALGHIHAYKKEVLDARGTYCYCGCLEGRGFDECGEHGFVLLDVNEEDNTYTHEFIPFAQRRLYALDVDVTGCLTSAQMAGKVEEALFAAGCTEQDLIKIVLKGMVDVACEKDMSYFSARFSPQFYFIKFYDETVFGLEMGDYFLDASLKGEYVRQVMADDTIAEEDKKIVIRYGLQAISGEEVE